MKQFLSKDYQEAAFMTNLTAALSNRFMGLRSANNGNVGRALCKIRKTKNLWRFDCLNFISAQ